MQIAVQLEFKVDRKEPLGDLVRRVAALFASNHLEPQIQASFSDGPPVGLRKTSAVERALKKYPHLARLDRNDAARLAPNLPPIRRLSNADSDVPFPLADVIALAVGVPRSLPFHAVSVSFGHAGFGGMAFPPGLAPPLGISVSDAWWVNGRTRSLTGLYSVEGSERSRTLPDPPPAIAAILAGLGKARSKGQFAAPDFLTVAAAAASPDAVPREIAIINPILRKYRTSELQALVARIGLPYDLPPALEAMAAARGAGGPLKPALVAAFSPRGYDCRGGSGLFSLRRRTPTNHIIDIELDVGTWSRSVTFMFSVRGPGYNASLMPPVTARDASHPHRQYPIGDTANWERIVANIAAIADELERTFVVEVTSVVDPAPAWFDAGR